MGKRLKILFITNIPAPYRVDFYNELGKSMDVTVIFEAKRAPGITFNWKEDDIKNFKAIFLSEGEIKEKRIDWSVLIYLKDIRSYDNVVVTNYAYFTEMAALTYIKCLGVPYYYELDGAMIDREESSLKRVFKKIFLRGAKAYFSPSKLSDEYVRYYAGNKAVIVRYPFTSILAKDIELTIDGSVRSKIKADLHLENKKIILAVGQFIRRKGFDILLRSLKGIDGVECYIVGGKTTDELITLKNRLNLTNVHFESFKTKEELAQYFLASDLFVLPTREDIWGLVINEAMAYGLPVITTNKCVAGMELLNHDCIVEVENVGELHDKIVEFLKNDVKRNAFAAENLKKIQNYTIESMAKVHFDYFTNLAKS